MKHYIFNICREIVYIGVLLTGKAYLYSISQFSVKDVLKQAQDVVVNSAPSSMYYTIQCLLGFLVCFGVYRLISEIVNLVKSEAGKKSSRFKTHLKD